VAKPQPAAASSPADPGALHARLVDQVQQAAGWREDPQAALEYLGRAGDSLQALVEALREHEPPPALVLPPFRQTWAVFVASPGDVELAADVATALETDLATARQVALLPQPRAALRSDDRADLERRAEQYRLLLDLPACVFDQDILREQPAAVLALALCLGGPWVTAQTWHWTPTAEQLAAFCRREDPEPELRLVVAGEVVIRRFRRLRSRRRREEGRLEARGERRVGVLDLHHDQGVVRAVQGVTDLGAWPGLASGSAPLAFRGLQEQLAEQHARIQHVPRGVYRPTREPEELEDGLLEATGWPSWEEHSRACRCLYMSRRGRRG